MRQRKAWRKKPVNHNDVLMLDLRLGREARWDDALQSAQRFRQEGRELSSYAMKHHEVVASRRLRRTFLESAIECVRAARQLRQYPRCRWCRKVFEDVEGVAVCRGCRDRMWDYSIFDIF